MIAEYQKKWNMNLKEWLLHHQRNIHFKYRYCGLEMQKNPMDMMVYMELIQKIKPNIIIEIGAAGGGTALWLAHQLELIWGGAGVAMEYGKVLSLDINHGGFKAEHDRIHKITGDSTKQETADKVYETMDKFIGSSRMPIMIIHDGSHKKEDIKKDFELYGKLVTKDSYFIIEDGIMDVLDWKDHRTSGHDCGMFAGIEINKENPDWVIDKECEKYVITYNPCGYLRRIK